MMNAEFFSESVLITGPAKVCSNDLSVLAEKAWKPNPGSKNRSKKKGLVNNLVNNFSSGF
jgi:hypothetical protein